MSYNYTEEHYAEMYNNLPEGLKDLVLSGRLAIQVSAIGSRHGLNADQVADLEPAVEDVCLGLILKTQLADNIKTQVGVDDRVANRIAAEVEIEILRPFEPELVIARQQKEDLDKKISSSKTSTPNPTSQAKTDTQIQTPIKQAKEEFVPKDVSEKTNVKAIKDFYNNSNTNISETPQNNNQPQLNNQFDWDNFGKSTSKTSEDIQTVENQVKPQSTTMSVDEKIDKLTDTINKLVIDRFGGEKKEEGVSDQMKELMRRLEVAEKENQENKKLIQTLQNGAQLNHLQKNTQPTSAVNNFFDDLPLVSPTTDGNKINVDKPRTVSIDKSKTPTNTNENISGNVIVTTTTQNSIPINQNDTAKKEPNMFSSVVSQATADTIVETRNKENQPSAISSAPSSKKSLSLDELLQKNDHKIESAKPTTAQIIFPTIGTEKKIDITNIAQTDGLRKTLLDDIEFIKNKILPPDTETKKQEVSNNQAPDNKQTDTFVANTDTTTQTSSADTDVVQDTTTNQSSVTLNQFKDELIPKTKEDRMKALQDKIKAMNKGVSVGGADSIAANALDPYKL